MAERDMTGRTCLVTGANAGIGKVVAMELARRKAKVVMITRNHIRGEAAQQEIQKATGNKKVQLFLGDLSSMASVRTLSEQLRKRFSRIDVLVNNAGGYNHVRHQTSDGYETTFAVNYLSHYLLTSLLIDRLRETPGARIINVTSAQHKRGVLNFDDLQSQASYDGWRAYAQSKLAQVLFTYELARRIRPEEGVTVNCLHPGWVATGFGKSQSPLYLRLGFALTQPLQKTPEQGAETPIYLATSEEVTGITGKYFVKQAPVESSPQTYDEKLARRLWDVSTRLTGMTAA